MANLVGRLARVLPDYARTGAWAISRRFSSSRAPVLIVQGVVLSEAGVLLAVRVEPRGWELPGGNPEPGEDTLPVMGFTAMRLGDGMSYAPPRRSASAAFHVVAGQGRTTVNGETIEWGPKDTFTAPVFAEIDHVAEGDAYLIRVHDRPLQEKLGYYEEWPR